MLKKILLLAAPTVHASGGSVPSSRRQHGLGPEPGARPPRGNQTAAAAAPFPPQERCRRTDVQALARAWLADTPAALAAHGNISTWDTSNATALSNLFRDAVDLGANLNSWQTSRVTETEHMFHGALGFNSGLWRWDTRNIVSVAFMFDHAKSFNGNIGAWDTARLENMQSLYGVHCCSWGMGGGGGGEAGA